MKLKLREQHVGTSSGPLLQLLGSGLDIQVHIKCWKSWKSRDLLGLSVWGGGEELIFLWSFPRPILHFEMEQIPTAWLVLILVEKFASVSAF